MASLYFKTSRKEKKKQARDKQVYTCCHLCQQVGGTLKRERDLKGKKLKSKDGQAVYYHTPCKVTSILNDFADQQAKNNDVTIEVENKGEVSNG